MKDTAPFKSDMASYFVPYFAPDEPDKDEGYWSFANDYLNDGTNSSDWKTRQHRTAKYNNKTPSRGGPNEGCDLQPIKRLTTDMDGLKNAIDDMVASGTTDIPMGLVWGWHTLSPNAPFEDGAAYGAKNNRKIIILMTDGDNVNNTTAWYNYNGSYYGGRAYLWQGLLDGANEGSSGAARTQAMDNRLALLCENIKAKDIVLYTVRVEVRTGDSALLRNCATDPEKFYDVQYVSQLGAAFDAIAGSIDNLRITK